MSGVFFGISILALILGAVVTLANRKGSAKASFSLAALAGLFAIIAGLAGIYGEGFRAAFDLGYGLGSAGFRLDGISSFFVFVSGVVVAPVSIYTLNYQVQGPRWAFAALYNLLLAATLLVFVADNAFVFLVFWEITAILFYGLVSFEDFKEGRVGAGYLYSAASKLGTALILASFLLAFAKSGSFSFENMAAAQLPYSWGSAAFVLSFVGFGLKAGMVPVQVWLPDAHSRSPKPISALLAGVVLNLGFYGLVKFNLQTLGPGPEWWGILVLMIGGVSAVVGILYAITQRDLSRFVAYSSVENAGIILLGIGVSMLGWSEGLGPLAALGLLVALYHTLHHSVSKSLLFLGVGAVDHTSGTTEMDRLGGLGRRLPMTSVLFFVGAFSLAAMPPSSGFVTEWFSFETLMQGFRLSSFAGSVSMALGGAFLALASALAILGFVKIYGSVFLGRPRSKYPAEAGEPPVGGRVGMTLLALGAVALGVVAPLWIRLIGRASSGIVSEGSVAGKMFGEPSLVLQPPYPDFSVVSPSLLAIALPLLLLLPFGIVVAVRRPEGRRGAVWASGERRLEGVEYTSRGFSSPIRTVFRDFYRPREELKGRTYTSRILPWLESSFYEMAASLLLGITRRMKPIQSGSLSAYLTYMFGVLLIVLVFVAVR